MKQKCCVNKELSGEFSGLARFLRIVGDDNRLKILCLLRGEEMCVCDITENLGLAQNLVSSHLKVLKDSGLITNRQEGKRSYYSINREEFKKRNISLINFFKTYER